MSINIQVSDLVGFKVEGFINDEKGDAKPFSFRLVSTRLDQDDIDERIQNRNEETMIDFMVSINQKWFDVKDQDGKTALEYSEEEYRRLCKIPGLGVVAFRSYLKSVGAKEKN